jgi:DNA polymerase-4
MSLSTLFVDLNSYFASVEQELRPELRGRPVAVVPLMADTTCCIAASYEAKRFGVKTGTRVGDAKRMCPGLALVEGRPATYVKFHHEILAAAETVLPVHSVHSIDEFSCRLLGAQREPEAALGLASGVKRAIAQRVGPRLLCSIGIAPNRLLAKVASDMQKPDGLVVIRKQDLPQCLLRLELTDLPGVGPKMRARLAAKGVTTMEQFVRMTEGEAAALWESVVGRWWFHMLRGDELPEAPTLRRSISHSHVLGPERRNEADARGILVRLLDKAAARARKLDYWAKRMTVSLKYLDGRKWNHSVSFPECHDSLTLVELFAPIWAKKPAGTLLRVGVALDELAGMGSATPPLFAEAQGREGIAKAMDAVNAKYGRSTVFIASAKQSRTKHADPIAFGSIPEIEAGDVEREADDDQG